jgi:hypothetical protein
MNEPVANRYSERLRKNFGTELYYPTAYQTFAAFRPRRRRPRKFRFDYKNSAADQKVFRQARKEIKAQTGYRKPPKRRPRYPGDTRRGPKSAFKPWWSYL